MKRVLKKKDESKRYVMKDFNRFKRLMNFCEDVLGTQKAYSGKRSVPPSAPRKE